MNGLVAVGVFTEVVPSSVARMEAGFEEGPFVASSSALNASSFVWLMSEIAHDSFVWLALRKEESAVRCSYTCQH